MQQVEVVLLGPVVILVQMGMEEAVIFMVIVVGLLDRMVVQQLRILVQVEVVVVNPTRLVVMVVQE
jgi:hypothetical protein